jgi:hypothetical protein
MCPRYFRLTSEEEIRKRGCGGLRQGVYTRTQMQERRATSNVEGRAALLHGVYQLGDVVGSRGDCDQRAIALSVPVVIVGHRRSLFYTGELGAAKQQARDDRVAQGDLRRDGESNRFTVHEAKEAENRSRDGESGGLLKGTIEDERGDRP